MNMGRQIRKIMVGRKENLPNIRERLSLVDHAEVYWGDNNSLVVVAPDEWAEYLTDKTDTHPRDRAVSGTLSPREISEVKAVLFNEM